MPSPSNSPNKVTLFAFALSAVLAVTVAVLVMKGSEPARIIQVPVVVTPSPTPADPVAEATPAPTEKSAAPTPDSPEPSAAAPTGGALLKLTSQAGAPVFLRVRNANDEAILEEVITPSSGFYERRVPAPGRVLASAVANNRAVMPAKLVDVAREGEVVELDLPSPGIITVRGRVLAGATEPAPGVPIAARRVLEAIEGGGTVTEEVPAVLSDDRGAYEIRVPAAPNIELYVPESPQTEEFLPSPPLTFQVAGYGDGERGEMTLLVQRGQTLEVQVTDSEGLPIEGAEVRLSGPAARIRATASDGRALIPGLARGHYELSVSAPGHAPQRLFGVPVPGAPAQVLLPRVASIHGDVVVPKGLTPRDGNSLRLFLRRDRDVALRAEANPVEPIAFENLAPGNWDLIAVLDAEEGPAVGRASLALAPGARERVGPIKLAPLGTGRGRLLGGALPPPERLETAIEDLAVATNAGRFDTVSFEGFPLPSARTTDLGVLSFENIEPGRRYLLTVRDRETGVTLAAAEFDTPIRDLLLVPAGGTGTVLGSLRDELGIACVGRSIELIVNLAVFDDMIPKPERRRATTSHDGSFRFDHGPAGRARLLIDGDATTERYVTVQSGGTITADLECISFQLVRFDVVTESGGAPAATESLLIMSRGGTSAPETMIELRGGSPEARLAPGSYYMIRAATMRRAPFEVRNNISGPLRIEFLTEPQGPQPTPVSEPIIPRNPVPAPG